MQKGKDGKGKGKSPAAALITEQSAAPPVAAESTAPPEHGEEWQWPEEEESSAVWATQHEEAPDVNIEDEIGSLAEVLSVTAQRLK
eukprot:2075223-Amphidinium_carterae.1